MNLDLMFKVLNTIVLLPWLLMLILPTWHFTKKVIYSYSIPFILSLSYLWLVVNNFEGLKGGFDSFEDLKALFSNDSLLLVGWIHYLAFDLLVGSWELKDSHKLGIKHWQVIPCLLLTFLLGPIGWLCYWVLRYYHTRKFIV